MDDLLIGPNTLSHIWTQQDTGCFGNKRVRGCRALWSWSFRISSDDVKEHTLENLQTHLYKHAVNSWGSQLYANIVYWPTLLQFIILCMTWKAITVCRVNRLLIYIGHYIIHVHAILLYARILIQAWALLFILKCTYKCTMVITNM